MSETVKLEKSMKAFCGECGGERNCYIRGEFGASDDYDSITFWRNWYILQCMGCEFVFVLRAEANSEDLEYGYDERGEVFHQPEETRYFWPALAKRKQPEWFQLFSTEQHLRLNRALHELYTALENDLTMLAAVGVRACFDYASSLCGVDDNLSFEDKIGQLALLKKIEDDDRERLVALVESGNASVHRGWDPSLQQLNVLVDILEHFLRETFVSKEERKKLNESAREVRASVPARLKKKLEKPQSAGGGVSAVDTVGSSTSPSVVADNRCNNTGEP